MKNYKVFIDGNGEQCYKIHMAWSDQSQPGWRSKHRESSDLVRIDDCVIWNEVIQDHELDEDFLDEWLQTSIDNDYQGDDYEEDVWDTTWSLEIER